MGESKTSLEEPILKMISPSLEAMGYEVVRVLFTAGRRPTLQVMTERIDGQDVTVDDCAQVSRTVSALLDVEDPIKGAYQLEVSSPGIDRPLTRRKDFSRFSGHLAKVETKEAMNGRRRFQGTLLGIDDDRIRLDQDGETLELDFNDVRRAKLVLTDELIAKTAKS
ncbi:MAG: ribosome maturation factor RimP [Alphaproteobacteria bacterium]|nr:ribosome maturation factor RimP [Alphaproteobacteria bacterium]